MICFKAEYWLRKSIEQGPGKAVEQSSAKALVLLSRIFVDLGKKSLDAGNEKEANGFFEKVAQLGDEDAFISIAYIYLNRKEKSKAIEWLDKAEEKGLRRRSILLIVSCGI